MRQSGTVSRPLILGGFSDQGTSRRRYIFLGFASNYMRKQAAIRSRDFQCAKTITGAASVMFHLETNHLGFLAVLEILSASSRCDSRCVPCGKSKSPAFLLCGSGKTVI